MDVELGHWDTRERWRAKEGKGGGRREGGIHKSLMDNWFCTQSSFVTLGKTVTTLTAFMASGLLSKM